MEMILELLRPLAENKAWDYCIVWKIGDDPSRCIEWIGCCCSGSQGDLTGTQLVVPVNGGLIELFRTKFVPADQSMIETLMAQLGIIVDYGFHGKDSKTRLNPYPYHHIVPKLELLFPVPQPISIDSTHVSQNRFIDESKNSLGYGNSGDGKEIRKVNHKIGKEQFQSKNLVTERNRRKRMKDGLYTLRALVPRISKMDKAAIVGDAIEYIKELEKNVKELQDELKELEEQDCMMNNFEAEVCKPKRAYESSTQTSPKPHFRVSNVADKKISEVQVEVHQIGARDFLLKLICSHKSDGFLRILEMVDSLGLEVIDVNVTTCHSRVLNILKVKAKGKEVSAKNLKDSLLLGWSCLKVDREKKPSMRAL
ncbi:Myc-type, basic helix-loop-helix (bHLH) domain-containing protein [Cynara cardunculus var. scolymus]|uniref:Myc-type, basic helix-loop-helix (BHLH) domain-containing protein n=1 Tax=Cynara cardunculus var. scolymus TaxID=59895 RepID=A0A124SG92_CYNCS|nr:Myc-type, basic helix-loop-helix (bHLH) domain-containing protein [Cynara cardunculus var. scolymus]